MYEPQKGIKSRPASRLIALHKNAKWLTISEGSSIKPCAWREGASLTPRRIFAGNGQAAETGAEIKANQRLVLNSPICNVNEQEGQGQPKRLKWPERNFLYPLKSRACSKPEENGETACLALAAHQPCAGVRRTESLPRLFGVGRDGGQGRSTGKSSPQPQAPTKP